MAVMMTRLLRSTAVEQQLLKEETFGHLGDPYLVAPLPENALSQWTIEHVDNVFEAKITV
ncbi:hypothetical protein TYRP_021286 [Tyrophagus putrescentiae]|nr:hypothetical protein TYRP_021286 [Tyrophagus putrescentiae]